ncbi:hypothetical protein Barb6_01968 [Bacteroidales bacterium Barb6]|nr:hypothetical protein Barb6_01968 [Bacteroidales bacterium Barb6]
MDIKNSISGTSWSGTMNENGVIFEYELHFDEHYFNIWIKESGQPESPVDGRYDYNYPKITFIIDDDYGYEAEIDDVKMNILFEENQLCDSKIILTFND